MTSPTLTPTFITYSYDVADLRAEDVRGRRVLVTRAKVSRDLSTSEVTVDDVVAYPLRSNGERDRRSSSQFVCLTPAYDDLIIQLHDYVRRETRG